jgi:succinate-semialdehyde dehydrogenase/glutarate-semialdehyde dehydrogenase
MTYFLIDGVWSNGAGVRRGAIRNPATGETIGELPFAEAVDLDRALEAAAKGFETWRKMSAFERSAILRNAAHLTRQRAEAIAQLITREQGKPISEARVEASGAGDHIDWYAEEGRRAYGRVIPPRQYGARQIVLKEPVGPVAAFSPWNFPVGQLVRKVAGALAAGCSIIAKAPEEAPSSCVELIRAFHDAGVPAGVINLVFGVPAEISERLVASPVVRKVSFTGSVPVGRHLGALAASHVKRATMELGGHAPFIVCDDVDVSLAAKIGAGLKFRNAGQVCASPTRFYVQEGVFDDFVDRFLSETRRISVGDGRNEDTRMGPLAHARRVDAIEGFVEDARKAGADVACGGERLGNSGFFFAPTILVNAPDRARIMKDEPFGPVAALNRFTTIDEVIGKSNALPYGLAAFAFTNSVTRATQLGNELESGMVSINHFGLAAPETPFGGVKDSGYGSEGGSEGLEAFLSTKFISQIGL